MSLLLGIFKLLNLKKDIASGFSHVLQRLDLLDDPWFRKCWQKNSYT